MSLVRLNPKRPDFEKIYWVLTERLTLQFEPYVAKLCEQEGDQVTLVTVGPLAVRQVLHPEALRKETPLSELYYKYYDLKREIKTLLNNNGSAVNSLVDIVQRKFWREIRIGNPEEFVNLSLQKLSVDSRQ